MKLVNTVGINCHAVALSSLLNYYDYPLSEAMCFGLSSSFDFSYSEVRFSKENYFKCFSGTNDNDFCNIAELLELEYILINPNSEKELKKTIKYYIDQEIPIIASICVDKYMDFLQENYYGNRKTQKVPGRKSDNIFDMVKTSIGNHVTLITNIGRVHIRLYEPGISNSVILPWKLFCSATLPKGDTILHPANTLHYLRPTKSFEELQPVFPKMICHAICKNMYSYLNSDSQWYGIDQINRMKESVFDSEDEKEIKKTARMFNYICDVITGGGFYRRMYCHFLQECGRLYIKEQQFEDMAKRYMQISRKWTKLSKDITKNAECINKNKIDIWVDSMSGLYQEEKEAASRLCKIGEYLCNVL